MQNLSSVSAAAVNNHFIHIHNTVMSRMRMGPPIRILATTLVITV